MALDPTQRLDNVKRSLEAHAQPLLEGQIDIHWEGTDLPIGDLRRYIRPRIIGMTREDHRQATGSKRGSTVRLLWDWDCFVRHAEQSSSSEVLAIRDLVAEQYPEGTRIDLTDHVGGTGVVGRLVVRHLEDRPLGVLEGWRGHKLELVLDYLEEWTPA